jgi:hypothetical protein
MAQTGVQASVFYDRIEALRARVNLELYVILGHAMAHEIGHVLLGSREHATGGLMQANWNPATWRLASAGLLNFSPKEAKQMVREAARYRPSPDTRLARTFSNTKPSAPDHSK